MILAFSGDEFSKHLHPKCRRRMLSVMKFDEIFRKAFNIKKPQRKVELKFQVPQVLEKYLF